MSVLDTLAVLRPGAQDSTFLRACLGNGQAAREAWMQWCARCGGSEAALQRDLASVRTLLPLLSRSVANSGLAVQPGILAYLHAATLREELRAARMRTITAEILKQLESAGIRALLLRGVALACSVYDAWSLRHCHDLELLVAAADVEPAMRALGGVQCAVVVRPRAERTGARLQHASGLGVCLHAQAFPVRYYDTPRDCCVRGAGAASINGIAARVPSPEASIVHVLGNAGCSSSWRHLRWVADAWHLTRRNELQWEDVCEHVQQHRIALPFAVLLRYVHELGANVPAEAVTATDRLARQAGPEAEDVAIGGALAARSGDVRSVWRAARAGRNRTRLARWMLAPSPIYVRGALGVRSSWLLPLGYLYRPVRFVAGRLSDRAKSAAASTQR